MVHFPNFGARKFFPENSALSRTTSYGFLVPVQNLEKFRDTIPRKRPDRRKDGRTEGQTDPISYDPSGYRLDPTKQNTTIQPANACSKLTIKTLEQSVEYVQS